MNNFWSFLKENFPEILRSLIIASVFFGIALAVDNLILRASLFALLAIGLAAFRSIVPSHLEDNLDQLKGNVERMAEGNLDILRTKSGASSSGIGKFSSALQFLNARLRQIVDKVKSLAGSVG